MISYIFTVIFMEAYWLLAGMLMRPGKSEAEARCYEAEARD